MGREPPFFYPLSMARKFRPLQPRKRGGKMSDMRQCSRHARKQNKKKKEDKGGAGILLLALLFGLT
jgi:hypothetical protein